MDCNLVLNMMYNVAIIGAGQLGSRHLQGIKLSYLKLNIFVVDTNEESLIIAKERYEQIGNNGGSKNLYFYHSMEKLPEYLDLVIVATSSAPRFSITKELIRNKKVSYILFEKVLFQSLNEYSIVSKLLAENKIKAWVNCTRRLFSHYQELSKITLTSKKIDFKVIGENWGLGCNSVHFLDLFAFLTGESDVVIDTDGIDNEILKSKRVGYVEFTGTITGKTLKGNTITLSSLKECDSPLTIYLLGDNFDIKFEESSENIRIVDKTIPIQQLFQSQLTGIVSEQILLHGNSDLVSFEDSAKIHIEFISKLLVVYSKITGNKMDICPIT